MIFFLLGSETFSERSVIDGTTHDRCFQLGLLEFQSFLVDHLLIYFPQSQVPPYRLVKVKFLQPSLISEYIPNHSCWVFHLLADLLSTIQDRPLTMLTIYATDDSDGEDLCGGQKWAASFEYVLGVQRFQGWFAGRYCEIHISGVGFLRDVHAFNISNIGKGVSRAFHLLNKENCCLCKAIQIFAVLTCPGCFCKPTLG